MRSSSTDPGTRFLPVGTGAWARLALVAALGVGAVLAPAVDRTGAIYTDQERVAFDIQGPPAPTATADPTPTADPTATVDPAQLAAPAALSVAAPAPSPTPSPAPAASEPVPSPSPSATAEATAAPTATAPLPTPWRQGPDRPRRGR